MAPRRQRPKVGLTRMHAALDAMRPMGFSADVVRRCVKNLLKVYGDDGWVFIEEAAYKLLIDTILEEPEVPLLEYAPQHPPLESGAHECTEQPESVQDKEVVCEEKICALNFHEAEKRDGDVHIGQKKCQEEDLDVKVTSLTSQDVNAWGQVGVQCGFMPSCTPQTKDSTPTNLRLKPCYGWISEDDDNDDLLQLTPANSIDN